MIKLRALRVTSFFVEVYVVLDGIGNGFRGAT